MRIYFARHGESEANVLGEFSNRGQKHALTEKGREQAFALARNLDGIELARILTSPLLRALESAQIVGQILNAPVEVADPLREWDVGILEGRSDAGAWDQYRRLRQDWASGEKERRIEGGESLADVEQRLGSFVRGLVARSAPSDRVVLMGHGGLYCVGLPLLLENVDAAFAEQAGLDHTELIVVEASPAGLRCTHWGETLLSGL